ncbi:glycosyltransferase family 4 protein [Methanotrichaceae archaeon M04Ac]|uniref:Glycosyltransferase family 4 protein n=1 Tax=Candidatus Methanocrinis alkalitolerans TaxID=3033395 RepID=A0ABT5XGB7_9EURY|nr:glycosyltransferase family 4 protein [Candidatus Methanocrinis alkalitolerans]MDF0593759.1 glycosyltransferase family 4 protein [Candidatus Methanocrinis alkalitolerans]
MKIAYIHDVIYPHVKGGAEKRVWEISRRLAERGHEVTIFGMKYWDGERAIEREGVRLCAVCDPMDLYVDGRRSIKAAVIFSSRLLRSFRGEFDVIDAQQFPYLHCFPAKVHSVLGKTPLVITWHEVWGDYWREYLGWKGMVGEGIERLAVRLPDKIIPVSEMVRDDLSALGVNGVKMEVVANGVDLRKIDSVEAAEPSCDVIYAGRLSAHKRVDLLIEAVGIAKKDLPEIRCCIVGDGPEREKLARLAEELKIQENVDFLGFLDSEEEVTAKMKSSKVFVLPSMREGFGISLLEANASGLPAVVVDAERSAAAALIKEGVNGVLCDPSAPSMASKMIDLLSDGSYKKMARDSKEFARGYDWSDIARKVEGVYERL